MFRISFAINGVFTEVKNRLKAATEGQDLRHIPAGHLEPLTKEELATLVDFYFGERINNKLINEKEKIVLRRFLFSCSTALRISDLKMLTLDNFTPDGKMSLKPHKTGRYGTTVMNKPLNDLALILLGDEIKERTDRRLFHRYNEQYSNELLKEIAKGINIKRRIYHHVGRATFASLYDQAGGNHRSLMEYMGLKKMNTLMRYVKTNEKVIADAIGRMNESMSGSLVDKIRTPLE